MPDTTPPTPSQILARALPLQRTLVACPGCGARVLVRVWRAGQWVELEESQRPVSGTRHVCGEESEQA